jgi:DEAD/DEAH box helicase
VPADPDELLLSPMNGVCCAALLAKLDEAARAQRGEEQNRSESSKRRGTAGKATAAAAGAAAPSHSQQHKKRPANAAADSTAGVAALDAEDSGAATAQLQARLRKLEAENRALKKQQQKQQKKQRTTTSDAAAPAEGPQQQQQQHQKKKKTDGEKEPHNQEQQEGVAHKTRRERKAEAAAARREQTRARLRALREARKASKQAAQNERAAAAATAAGAGAAAQGGSDGVAGAARPPAVMAAADMSAWDRFSLHPALLTALAARGFSTPTPIQEAVLLPASRDRRDIIGAAATGSGKTLAFGLPILQQLLTERETAAGTAAAAAGSGSRHDRQDTGSGSVNNTALRALILAPTRELALQASDASTQALSASCENGQPVARPLIFVFQHLSPLTSSCQTVQCHTVLPDYTLPHCTARLYSATLYCQTIHCHTVLPQVCEHLSALGRCVDLRVASVVGGIAPVKQERLLAARPAVVVATPGRLWDLMRNGQRHVNNLASLSFFVLDEADRMVQQGHYAELSHILDMLPTRRRAEVAAAAADAEAAEAAALDSAAAETRAQLRRRNHQLRTPRNGSSEADDGSDGGGGDDDDDDGAADELHEEEGDSGDDMDSGGDDDDDSGGDSMDAGAADAADDDDDGGDDGSENHTDAAAAAAAGDSGMVATVPSRSKRHLLQIMVFSATLTLPAALHKRLRRGGGGSSGAASLESLMDRWVVVLVVGVDVNSYNSVIKHCHTSIKHCMFSYSVHLLRLPSPIICQLTPPCYCCMTYVLMSAEYAPPISAFHLYFTLLYPTQCSIPPTSRHHRLEPLHPTVHSSN